MTPDGFLLRLEKILEKEFGTMEPEFREFACGLIDVLDTLDEGASGAGFTD